MIQEPSESDLPEIPKTPIPPPEKTGIEWSRESGDRMMESKGGRSSKAITRNSKLGKI